MTDSLLAFIINAKEGKADTVRVFDDETGELICEGPISDILLTAEICPWTISAVDTDKDGTVLELFVSV